jgi:hypothetical protein
MVATVEAFGHPLDPIAEEFTSGVYLVGYDIPFVKFGLLAEGAYVFDGRSVSCWGINL